MCFLPPFFEQQNSDHLASTRIVSSSYGISVRYTGQTVTNCVMRNKQNERFTLDSWLKMRIRVSQGKKKQKWKEGRHQNLFKF